MENIENIFYKGQQEQPNIIKSVDVDWDVHSKGVLNIIESKQPNYIIGEEQKKILKYLLQYFTGSSDFPDDLNKGLWIIGNVGSGKTLLFESFKKYTGEILRVNSFNYYTANEIISNTEIEGQSYLSIFSDDMENGKPNPRTVYIDDCFSGSDKIKHYGTDKNVIESIIELRYNVYKKYRKLTHISTNVNPGDVGDLFTDKDRLTSRMQEMFNMYMFNSKDFRTI